MSTFQGRFGRPEGEEALERSLTGRRTERPTKHCATLAAAVPGTSAPRWQELLTTRPWDAHARNRQRVATRIAAAPGGHGVLMFDETGVAKQGKAAVGVARPSAGTLGKVGPCQVAVPCGSSAPHARWPVAVRLALPQEWPDAPARLRRARGPAAVPLPTQPQSALALLEQARAWGVPPRGVVAEAAEGDHPHFLAGLEARRAR